MKIEIDNRLESKVLAIAKYCKISSDEVVENALVFTMAISQLSDEQLKIISQLLKDNGFPSPFENLEP